MAFQQYVEKYKSFLNNWSASASGNGITETFDYKINTAQELNALQNATSVNDIVQLSNAYYDQVSIGRSMKELYKTPKDYLTDFVNSSKISLKQLDNLSNEVKNSSTNITNTTNKNKSMKILSRKLVLKLGLISSEFDKNA